jgi:hypothetical protein
MQKRVTALLINRISLLYHILSVSRVLLWGLFSTACLACGFPNDTLDRPLVFAILHPASYGG